MTNKELEDSTWLDGPELLRTELSRRITKNPRYSLRSFAKALDISPATLSLILARKTPMSKKTISKISQVIGLQPAQVESLKKGLHHRPHGNSALEGNYNQVTLDIFKVFSDWYHYAILSLLEIKGSSIEAKWISKKIGISIFEAREAVERLIRLDLIVEEKGRWRQSGLPIRITDDSTNNAARRFQKQLLLKAIDSLENDSVNVRDFSSMTFAMSLSDLPKARLKIESFRRKLTKELEKNEQPNSVYNLTVQLYPLTKESNK